MQPNTIKYRDVRYSHAPSGSKQVVTNAQSAPNLSQAPPEGTPTINVAAPVEDEEDEVKPDVPASAKILAEETEVVPSPSQTVPDLSDANPRESSATSHTPSPSQALQGGHASTGGTGSDSEKAELGQASACIPVGEGELKVQRSPPTGDTAGDEAEGVESSTGNDVRASVAQMEVVEAAARTSSHSPIPIPVVTADAGSRSHSPTPIPVASAIDTTVKGITSISTSDNHLSLKQGRTSPMNFFGATLFYLVQLCSI